MRISNRVTTMAMNQKLGNSVNEVHNRLNQSMNKISSGKAYESAAQNPLAYYKGKKLDYQYQEKESQKELLVDIQKRLESQEDGVYSIQNTLQKAINTLIKLRTETSNEDFTVGTLKQDLAQKQQSMINDLNGQYQDYFIFGGNDISTTPFSLSADGRTLTFSHTFPGDTSATEMKLYLEDNGTYTPQSCTWGDIKKAMQEQGRVDIGYGDISNRNTLLDTYTGGLNVLAGISSEAVNASPNPISESEIKEGLNNSPIALLGKAIIACDNYEKNGDKGDFSSEIGTLIDDMTLTHTRLGATYSDLGNKYSTLEDLEKKFSKEMQSLQEQYKNILGADPYESIMEMFSNQYSYSASLQLGSRLMQSSLFDFIR